MTTVHSSLIFSDGDTTILRRLLDDATPLDRAKALKREKLGRMRGLEMISGSADLMARHREQAQSRLGPSQSEAAR
ncbi:hypothetical protein ACVIKP_006929 [Rhizobium leguminosarum]